MIFISWILTSEKKDQVAWIEVKGGGDLGDSGNDRKKPFFLIVIGVFPEDDFPFLGSSLGHLDPK